MEHTRYALQTLENINAALEYGDPDLALKFAKNFLPRLTQLELPDKPKILGNLYSLMGQTYMQLNKPTLAVVHHRKDLDIAVKYNFKDDYLRSLGNLGEGYKKLKDYGQAIAMWEKKLMFVGGNQEAALCERIGRCYFEAGRFEDAVEFGERGAKSAAVAESNELESAIFLLLGESLLRLGQCNRAILNLEKHLQFTRVMEQPAAESNALSLLASAYLELGEAQKSVSLQQQALEVSSKIKINQHMAQNGSSPSAASPKKSPSKVAAA